MFFSLIRRAAAVAKFVEINRLSVDNVYKENVIQYLAEGRAFDLEARDGAHVSSIKTAEAVGNQNVPSNSTVNSRAA
jgi:hypothetical protein